MTAGERTPPERPVARPPSSAAEAWSRLLGPRVGGSGRRGQVVVAGLCLLLGFALATQVHSNRSTAGGLASARQDDLVGILADLSDRSDRLRDEISSLQRTRDRLAAGPGSGAAAVAAARDRARMLAVLAGTIPAHGPGITLTVSDARLAVPAATVLGALEELRDAGAEAMEISGTAATGTARAAVRIVASTYVIDASGGGITVDGHTMLPPYRLDVIGDPKTLAAALAIPGGVVETIERSGGAHASVVTHRHVVIRALRPLSRPQYARPAAGAG